MITPDLIEQQALELLGAHHTRYLAALERDRGLEPRSVEPLQTITVLDGDDQRLAIDSLPCLLLSLRGIRETSRELDHDGQALDVTWRMEIHVVAQGGGNNPRADGMLRARWLTCAAVECLLDRLPGAGPVGTVDLQSMEFEQNADDPGLTHSETQLDVLVRGAFSTGGAIGLEPESLDPYAPPSGPATATDLSLDITREPLES